MKKSFRSYALIWAILVAVFNAVIFFAKPVIPGYTISYDARFWIVWSVVIAAFIGNLACAFFAFKEKNLKKVFYKLPLIQLSYTCLVTAILCGTVLMLIPDCPAWVAAIVCVFLAAFNAIALIKASWASSAVISVDEKVRSQTSFIKIATVDVQNVMGRAKSDCIKTECKKVYEVLRYSDPMSRSDLASIETSIFAKISELSSAVDENDFEKVEALAGEIVALSNERNNKCRLFK